MAKGSNFDELARDAVARIEKAREAGEQLTFLPDEPAPGETERAKRGKGRANSQLRDWLAARGLRMPEDVLVEMAAMASTDDAFVTAMARTEQLLAWAEAGARQTATGVRDGVLVTVDLDTSATMAQRLAAFQFVFTAQLRAAEAMLPYVAAKVTPDVAVTMPVQVVQMPAPPAAAGSTRADLARDVTPQPVRIGPPPLPGQIQQNQQVNAAGSERSDADIRTDGVKR